MVWQPGIGDYRFSPWHAVGRHAAGTWAYGHSGGLEFPYVGYRLSGIAR